MNYPMIVVLVIAAGGQVLAQESRALRRERWDMVKRHVVGGGVENNRVVDVMRNTPRHLFVPDEERTKAYFDMALPIGFDQTISSPYIVAFMTAQIDPQPADKVLEIGTGSGYQAAVLSPLVKEVYSIEIVPQLGRRAAKTLERLGYANVRTRIGDGYQGWEEHAPFDKIIVTCSPEDIPTKLVEQLAEGGHIVIPVGERFQQTLCRFTKVDGELKREPLQATFFVPMTGQAEDERKIKPDLSRPALVNGGFEAGTTATGEPPGWYYLRQGLVQQDPSSPGGSSHIEFSSRTESRSAHALQSFGIDGRKVSKLRVSLWVRGRNIRHGPQPYERARVIVEFYGKNRAPVGNDKLGDWSGSFAWRQKRKTLDVPRKARLAVIGVGLFGATGTLSVDDVQLSPR